MENAKETFRKVKFEEKGTKTRFLFAKFMVIMMKSYGKLIFDVKGKSSGWPGKFCGAIAYRKVSR